MRILNFIFVVLFFNSVLIAQNYSIFGKIDDMPDGEVLLGYYYGDKQFVKDTVDSHHGFFHFESDKMIMDMKVQGSKENQLFYEYQKFTQKRGIQAEPLKKELKILDKNSRKYDRIKKQLKEIDDEVTDFKLNYMQKHFSTFFVKLLNAMEPIVIPESPSLEDGTIDSQFQYNYYKKHYWDHFDLKDDRMLRTPIFHSKMEKYLLKLMEH